MTQKQQFEDILERAGFTKIRTEFDGDTGWEYRKMGWYADVINYTSGSEVWMIGAGLKDRKGYPGGFRYHEPAELEEELSKYRLKTVRILRHNLSKMAAIPVGNGKYEIRVQEFAQPHTQTEAMGVTDDVNDWLDAHPVTSEVGGGTVYRIFPPIWLGSIGSGNPMWLLAYAVLLSHGV